MSFPCAESPDYLMTAKEARKRSDTAYINKVFAKIKDATDFGENSVTLKYIIKPEVRDLLLRANYKVDTIIDLGKDCTKIEW